MPDLGNVFWWLLAWYGTLLVGGLCGIPPEEIGVLGAGGWAAGSPEYDPYRWLALPASVAGILTSDILLYGIGRYWGTRLLGHRWLARYFTRDKLERIERNFHRYGIKVLLFVRWIPGIRSPLFLAAGTMRLPLLRFIVADTIAAFAGHTLVFFLGFWFYDSVKALFERVEGDVSRVRPILILVGILALALYLVIHFLRKPVSTADPEELPLIGHQVAVKIENPVPPPEAPPAEPKEAAPPAADGAPADQPAAREPAP